jgi:hypothetical protein
VRLENILIIQDFPAMIPPKKGVPNKKPSYPSGETVQGGHLSIWSRRGAKRNSVTLPTLSRMTARCWEATAELLIEARTTGFAGRQASFHRLDRESEGNRVHQKVQPGGKDFI